MGDVAGSGDREGGSSYMEGHAEWLVDRQRERGRWPRERSEIRPEQGTPEGAWRPTEGRKKS